MVAENFEVNFGKFMKLFFQHNASDTSVTLSEPPIPCVQVLLHASVSDK